MADDVAEGQLGEVGEREAAQTAEQPSVQDAPSAQPESAAADAGAERLAELERQAADLERQLQEERERATDYMRRWHSAQADFSNFKRRTQQEQQQRDLMIAAEALAPAIHALDSLERAFISLPESLRGFSWIEGIALVELQLRRALEMQGIRPVESAPGSQFDPQRHQAIGEIETGEHPEGAVVVVAQRGYEAEGLLIRPALVQVARAPRATAAETSESASASEEAPGAADSTGPTEAAPTS